jgi:hypothetical protein
MSRIRIRMDMHACIDLDPVLVATYEIDKIFSCLCAVPFCLTPTLRN